MSERTREPSASDGHDRHDVVRAAREGERDAVQAARSGRFDDDTVRELEIAVEQLRADLTNGENPEESLGRIRRLMVRDP